MAVALAEKIVEATPEPDTSTLRRFELPDMDRHRWMLDRLRVAYPHLNDRQLIGWLRAMIYSSEFQFLFQDRSVALFQIMSAHTLSPQPVVYERFVFCADKDSVADQAQASMFYVEAQKWGRFNAAGAIIVEQCTDVPHEMIRERMGRLLTRQEVFNKL